MLFSATPPKHSVRATFECGAEFKVAIEVAARSALSLVETLSTLVGLNTSG